MAYGSFAPLYTEPKQELMLARDRVGLYLLETLAWHCDELGLTWVGVYRISRMTGFAESSIEAKLEEFESRGWIKIHRAYNPVRRREHVDYQISPRILYIREELEEEAWMLWNNGVVMEIESNVGQPESLTRISNQNQPESGTRIRTTTTTKTSDLESGRSRAQKPEEITPHGQPNGSHKTNGKAKTPHETGASPDERTQQREAPEQQREAQDTESLSPPVPAAPPRKLTKYREPLADLDAENVAQRIRSEFNTRISQARELVDCHGAPSVEIAIQWIREEKRRGSVKNPVGLLRWWLQNNAINHKERPLSKYETGPYADMIER